MDDALKKMDTQIATFNKAMQEPENAKDEALTNKLAEIKAQIEKVNLAKQEIHEHIVKCTTAKTKFEEELGFLPKDK